MVACEESQAVTIELRKNGIEAFSCDIQECSGGHPEWHIKGDVSEVLHGEWDAVIAFPPCTYISNAGACRLYPQKGGLNQDRYEKGLIAKEFFMQFYNLDCKYVSIENPVSSTVFKMPKHTQQIQPWEYGHPFSKKTRLWLTGLPDLKPTNIITEGIISWVHGGSKNHKGQPRGNKGTPVRNPIELSKTFSGIASAMGQQWGDFLKEKLGVSTEYRTRK